MALALFVVFIVVPVLELAVILQVARSIGVLTTVSVLVLVSVSGAWLVKREGLGVLGRIRDQLARGQLPTDELVDGAIIVVAGALLLFPGFVSDALGLLILLPPVRAGVRKLSIRRFRGRLGAFSGTYTGTRFYDVVDVEDLGDRRGSRDPRPDGGASRRDAPRELEGP